MKELHLKDPDGQAHSYIPPTPTKINKYIYIKKIQKIYECCISQGYSKMDETSITDFNIVTIPAFKKPCEGSRSSEIR